MPFLHVCKQLYADAVFPGDVAGSPKTQLRERKKGWETKSLPLRVDYLGNCIASSNAIIWLANIAFLSGPSGI